MKMTATVAVREAVRKIGGREFSSLDITRTSIATTQGQKLVALRDMAKWGELEITRQVAKVTGGYMNMYKVKQLAPVGARQPRKTPEKRMTPPAPPVEPRIVAPNPFALLHDFAPEFFFPVLVHGNCGLVKLYSHQ